MKNEKKFFPLKDKVKAEPGRTPRPPIIVSKLKQKLILETSPTRIGREKFKENHEVKIALHVVWSLKREKIISLTEFLNLTTVTVDVNSFLVKN